jgi:predicted nucleic-acid-binding protein
VLGFDTNIIVRYVVRDDPQRQARADHLFDKEISKSNHGFVNAVVLAELVWVLERSYRFPRTEIATVIAELLGNEKIELEHSAQIEKALDVFLKTDADFADIVINFVNHARGCTTTLTFDRAQKHLETATVIG